MAPTGPDDNLYLQLASSTVHFTLPYTLTHPSQTLCMLTMTPGILESFLRPEYPFLLSTSCWIYNSSNSGSLVKLSSNFPPL